MNKSKYISSPSYRKAKRDLEFLYSIALGLVVVGLILLVA